MANGPPSRPRVVPPAGLTTESRIVGILEAFERQLDGVKGSAVADADGLPVANGFRENLDLLSVASMSTLGLQSAKKVFETIGLKGPNVVVLEGEGAKVVIFELGGGQASFIAVVRPEVKLGFLKLEMASAAKRLEEELGFAPPPDVRIEEVFLLTNGGLLITHASRTLIHPGDRDVLAAMMTVVQQFVRDAFQGKAGAMQEVDMANLRVRLIRGEPVHPRGRLHGAPSGGVPLRRPRRPQGVRGEEPPRPGPVGRDDGRPEGDGQPP